MGKKLIVVVLFLFFVLVGLSGCYDEFCTSDIEGIWNEGNYAQWNFMEDGNLIITYSNNTSRISWDMDSNYVYVIYDNSTIKYSYTSLNEGNTNRSDALSN